MLFYPLVDRDQRVFDAPFGIRVNRGPHLDWGVEQIPIRPHLTLS
jgi:hypothetical protein